MFITESEQRINEYATRRKAKVMANTERLQTGVNVAVVLSDTIRDGMVKQCYSIRMITGRENQK